MIVGEDTLKLHLKEFEQSLGTKKAWATPLSVLLTCSLAMCTATFQPRMGVPADTWQAVFLIAGFIAGVWFIVEVIEAIRKRCTVEQVISSLKSRGERKGPGAGLPLQAQSPS